METRSVSVDESQRVSADLLLDDYKVKLEYVRAQYDRLLQRFNFFLSVELALFGFLGYLTWDAGVLAATRLAAAMGIVVSLLWYAIGAEDRRLVEVYRQRADDAARRFAHHPNGIPDFDRDHAAADIPDSWRGLRSWYWSAISVTRMPATFGLLLTIAWVLVYAFWQPYVRPFLKQP